MKLSRLYFVRWGEKKPVGAKDLQEICPNGIISVNNISWLCSSG